MTVDADGLLHVSVDRNAQAPLLRCVVNEFVVQLVPTAVQQLTRF